MNHKVPISSSVFEWLELSVQKNLSAIGTVWAIRSSQLFERFELSVQKKLSAFGTVRAVPFKKIRQPFQLSVGKNKTVTSSFHWKVKCCKWSLRGDVFMSLRKYCRSPKRDESTEVDTTVYLCENLSSCWVFMAVDRDRIKSRLIYDKIFCTTLFTETPLR